MSTSTSNGEITLIGDDGPHPLYVEATAPYLDDGAMTFAVGNRTVRLCREDVDTLVWWLRTSLESADRRRREAEDTYED